MPLDPYARRFLDSLAIARSPVMGRLTIQQRRESLVELLLFAGAPASVAKVEEREMPGPGGPMRLRLYTPSLTSAADLVDQSRPLPGLVYFHGGGLVAGTLESHEQICCSLSQAGHCKVASVDYRLAPEHRFPAAAEDASAAVNWIGRNAPELGIDADRAGVSGDSAGAILAAVSCQAAVARGFPPLRLQLLLCPITDYAAETESRRSLASGYFLDRTTLTSDLEHYLHVSDNPMDPRISPLRASNFAGLPRTCIHTAEFDPVRDEAELYSQRLRQAGVHTTYHCHSGMIHLFYGMGRLIPYASVAYELIGRDIRSALYGIERS